MSPEPDPHDAVGAYVLDALPPDERAAFENHLAACTECRQEAAQLMDVVVRLAEATAVPPSSTVRARVLEEIRHTQQEQPARARRAQRLLPWALAACLAATAAAGMAAVWQHREAQNAHQSAHHEQQRASALTDVLTAPDATVQTGDLSNGARASVIVSRQKSRTAFVAAGLPVLGEGKVYQLWYADDSALRAAGLLPGSGGEQARILQGPLGRATAVGITVEPAGGSRQPTTQPLALIKV